MAGYSADGSAWARLPPMVDGGELDRALARHGAEPDLAVVLADVGEARDRVQVDERRGPGEAEVHERHEALAAGQELGAAAVAREERDRLLDGLGSVIVEPRRFHERASPLAPSGVSGEGETIWAMSITGASEAVGTR